MWLKSPGWFNCFRIFLVIPMTVIRKQFHVQNPRGALRVLWDWGYTGILPVCSNKHVQVWGGHRTWLSVCHVFHHLHKLTKLTSPLILCQMSISTIVLTWDVQFLQSRSFLTGIIMGTVPLQRMFVFIRVCSITSEMKLMNRYSGSHYTREIWKIILAYNLAGKGFLEWKKSLIKMVKEISKHI